MKGAVMLLFRILFCIVSGTSSGPANLIPDIMDSILAGKKTGYAEFFSREAITDMDSMIRSNPERVETMLKYFGIDVSLEESGITCGPELIDAVFAGDPLRMYLATLGVRAGAPLAAGGGIYVPLSWSLFGSRDTVYIRIFEEDGAWKIRDFFEVLPGASARMRRRGE